MNYRNVGHGCPMGLCGIYMASAHVLKFICWNFCVYYQVVCMLMSVYMWKIDGVWEDGFQQVDDWRVWHKAHRPGAGNGSSVLHGRPSQGKTCTGSIAMVAIVFSFCGFLKVLVKVFQRVWHSRSGWREELTEVRVGQLELHRGESEHWDGVYSISGYCTHGAYIVKIY